MLKRTILITAATALLGALALGASAVSAKRVCEDGSPPPCNRPPVGEAASNNLSYPVIWSDGVMKPDFVQSGAPWRFETVYEDALGFYTDVGAGPVYCVGEEDIIPPETIDADVLCYYGRLNEGLSEEDGEPVLTGDPQVWWLQQRQPYNQWQVFNTVDPDPVTPVVVTGVDTGDLLESSLVIKAKQIRTEFTLFKNVEGDTDFTGFREEYGCLLLENDPDAGTSPSNCFAAHSMSGAVPGTDQSIAETQGTESLTRDLMVDPRTVKTAKNYFDHTIPVLGVESEEPPDPRIVPIEPPLGIDATVYSACARLIIQKVTGDPASLYWDSDEGNWMPRSAANTPCVDISAWDGSYSAEINAGGSIIYGYNWNTKFYAEGAGAYRITFLLEGDADDGGGCTHPLNTVFDDSSMSVNVGERRPATLLSASALGGTRGEGGAVFVDVEIGTSGGGGGGRRR
jgi:hypothetical protein